jgi:hypothetical protein
MWPTLSTVKTFETNVSLPLAKKDENLAIDFVATDEQAS